MDVVISAIATYFSGTWGQVELVATGFLLMNVYLLARESIHNYIFGAIGVALYGLIFYEFKLYSDMLLQWVYYLPLQFIGWYHWMYGGRGKDNLPLRHIQPVETFVAGLSTVFIAIGMSYYMMTYTDASYPILDSIIVGMSVVANILLIKKVVENWIMWITLDFLAIYVYFMKGLYVASFLYLFFLVLATYGLLNWKSILRVQEAPLKFGRQ